MTYKIRKLNIENYGGRDYHFNRICKDTYTDLESAKQAMQKKADRFMKAHPDFEVDPDKTMIDWEKKEMIFMQSNKEITHRVIFYID